MSFSGVILLAGKGTRCGANKNKVLVEVNHKPIYSYSLDAFLKVSECNEVVLVVSSSDYDEVKSYIEANYSNYNIKITLGGAQRKESSFNGVNICSNEIVFVHDSARCEILDSDIRNMYYQMEGKNILIASNKVYDTIKQIDGNKVTKTIDRDYLLKASTPQVARKTLYLKYYELTKDEAITDEAMLFERYEDVYYYILENENKKITTLSDLMEFKNKMEKNNNFNFRVGHSCDTHPLVKGRKLWLGGVNLDYEYGLMGHSDSDCLLHAITESLIGAMGKGDIGTHFPDTDMKYKGMASSYFLKEAKKMLDLEGYSISNIDCIIYLEKPNLKNYKHLMAQTIANILEIDVTKVNVKATRKEGFGMVGRGEVIEAECVCLIYKNN